MGLLFAPILLAVAAICVEATQVEETRVEVETHEDGFAAHMKRIFLKGWKETGVSWSSCPSQSCPSQSTLATGP